MATEKSGAVAKGEVSEPTGPAESLLRRIPAVEKILGRDATVPLIRAHGRDSVKTAVVDLLGEIRRGETEISLEPEQIVAEVAVRLSELSRPSLRRAINGTGVLVHTNLGRSPVDAAIWSEAGEIATGYSNLEFNLASGQRGARDSHISAVAARLFGCEAALLTNNNAAGTLLLLAALASGKEVVVSRGELVEIGGSFRIPEVIEQGGAKLREVGTTNRTRRQDYIDAVGRRTAAFLRVHRSNFEIVGFTESPSIEELVSAAREKRVPLLYDEGSGMVVSLTKYGFEGEGTIRELFDLGVDIVTCSTDKLIGATQGGLILGRRDLVERCRRHPLMRAVRAGKEKYAVVTATLRAFLAEKHEELVPIYRMLATPIERLRERAEAIAARSKAIVAVAASALGGGTTPTQSIPSIGIAIAGDPEAISESFLHEEVPIVGRIHEGRFTIDLRTVDPADDERIVAAITRLRG